MSPFASDSWRHKDCEIQGCYLKEATSNWDDIISRIPKGIRPTDVDGMVEVNGFFLFKEEKPRGVSFSEDGRRGQARALKRLSAQPATTVMFFRPGKVSEMEVMVYVGGKTEGIKRMTRAEFLDLIEQWSEMASSF